MAGFSQGAIELKKKNLLSAAPNDFIKLSINTDNIPYTVDENGVYRYINYYDTAGISSYPLADLIDNGDGTCSILSATARLYSTNNFTGTLLEYQIPSATFTLIDGTEQYICVKYNSGTPIFYVENDKNQINESNVICVYCCWRQGNEIHSIGSDSKALGLSNKISLSITDTIPYRKSIDGGLILSESIIPNPRTVLITSANVYAGVIRNEIGAFDSSIDRLTLAYHSGGNWLYQDNLIYNNTQYDDGTNLQTIGNNKYAVRWFYRSIGDIKQTFYVLGLNQYNNISDARLENPRSDLPIVLRKHCILIARIIVEYNASSGLVENIADVTFSTTSIQNHNDLANIQGGSVGNYYHVSANTFSYLSAVSADIQQQLNSKVSSAGSPTNHNNLLNLQGGSSGNYYHVSASTFGYLSAVSADIQQQLNSKISSAAAPTNHNNLLGLQGGSSGNYYHVSASTFGYLSAVSADIQQQLESKVPKDLLNILQEPTGFINRTDTKLLFNDATRTFTISALTSSFDVYYRGNKFTKTTESIVIPNISGLHFIYYSSAGVLSQLNNIAWDLLTTIQVAVVYWTGTKSLGLCDERHGTVMDCATHEYLHNTFGTRYESGFNSTYTLSNDSSAYFGVSNGIISDEDLRISISQGSSGNYFTQQINYPGYFPVFYRSGSDGLGTWRKDPAIIFPYKNLGAGTRVTFNELSGTIWKQTETSNNNFVAYYIYATDEMYQPIIAVQGQRQDTSLINAQNNNIPGTLSLNDFPIVEAKLLYRIIVHTNALYTGNPFYARIVDVTDYRNQLVSTGSIIGGTGTVTSVGLSANPIFSIAGSPITNAGTFIIDLSAQSSGTFLAGSISGAASIPTFRKLTSSDIPPISNYYLPLSGGQLYGQMRGTSISASGNISAQNLVIPGSLNFGINSSAYGRFTVGTHMFLFVNQNTDGSIIDYPLIIEKVGSRIRLGTDVIKRPVEMGGPVTIQNLSATGFVRTNSSGLLTTSPLVSGDIPSLSYLPLAGGTLTGPVNGTGMYLTGNISASSFVKVGGTATQFLKANGTVDSNSYALNSSLGSYLPLSGGTLTGQLKGTSISASSNISANNFVTPGSYVFRNSSSAFWSMGATSSSIFIRNLAADSSVIDYPFTVYKTGTGKIQIGNNGAVRPVEIGGPVTIQNLSVNGFVRTNSSGLLTTSPLVSSEFPFLEYVPLSGYANITGPLNGTYLYLSESLSANYFRLLNADLATYTSGNLNPTKRIYQNMAGNDYWSIYGEGLYNQGSMILEVGDDYVDESIKLRFKQTNLQYITYTPFIFKYNSFYCDASISATGNAQIDGSLTVGNLSTGFVRSNSSGLLTSSPLVSSDLPSLAYLPLSGGTLTGQLKGTSISASGNVSGANFVGNLIGYKNVDNGNESTIANGFSGGALYINYRGSSSAITQYRFGNGINTGTYASLLASAFIRSGGTSNQFLKADGSTDSNSYALNSSLGNYLPLSGGTLTGGIVLSNVTTGVGLGIYGINGNNDGWTIRGGSSGTDLGYLEIATRDNGNEPIYVRQYADNFTNPFRTLTLLDGNGSSNFPGTLSALNLVTPGDLVFRNGSSAFGRFTIGTNDFLFTNQDSTGTIIDRPLLIEKFGLRRLRLGTVNTIRPIEMGGPVTIQNLSANGFVRSNSSGLLTTSPLVSGDIPSLSYLPLSGGTLTGQLKGISISASGNISAADTFFNSLRLSLSDLSAYDTGDKVPTKRLLQAMAGNDYWSIYGEGLSNAGAMILEVGDDLDETIKLRFKKTYTPFTTKTPYIFSYNTFDIQECRQRIYYDALIDSNTDYAENCLEVSTNTDSPSHSYKPGIGFHSRGQYASLFYLNGLRDWKAKDSDGEIITFYHTANLPAVLGNYLPLAGGTMTGNISFTNSTTGLGKGIYGTNGDNDHWRIIGGSNGLNQGYLEIATDDDKSEPIYIKQYQGTFSSPVSTRTLTLLDSNGNTLIPQTLSSTNYYNAGSYYVSNYAAGGNPSLITNQGVATFYTLTLDYYSTGERSLKFADSAYLGPTFASFFNNGSTQNNAIVVKGVGNSDYGGIYFGIPGINPRYIGTKNDNTLYIAGQYINSTGSFTQNGTSTFVGNTNIGRGVWPDEYTMTIYDKLNVSGTATLSNLTLNGTSKFNNNITIDGISYFNNNIVQSEGDTFLGTISNIDNYSLYNYNYSQFYGTSEFNNNVIFNDPITLNDTSQFKSSATFNALTKFNNNVIFNDPITLNDTSKFNSSATFNSIATINDGIINKLSLKQININTSITINDSYYYSIITVIGSTPTITLSDTTTDSRIVYIYNNVGSNITVQSSVVGGLEYTGLPSITSITLGSYKMLLCIKLNSGANNGGWKVRLL